MLVEPSRPDVVHPIRFTALQEHPHRRKQPLVNGDHNRGAAEAALMRTVQVHIATVASAQPSLRASRLALALVGCTEERRERSLCDLVGVVVAPDATQAKGRQRRCGAKYDIAKALW